jgi:DNA-binding MurR/RpiR family transcriptional regulator
MITYEQRIREAMPEFSPSFIRLADFLLDSYIQSAFLTATELAHTLDIDPATVVRFSQRLGYRGYPELQREIREKVKFELIDEPVSEDNTPEGSIIQALDEAAHCLEILRRSFPIEAAQELITILDESVRVIILADSLAMAPAQSLSMWLEAAGYTIHTACGSPSKLAWAVAGARRGDLVLAVEVFDDAPFFAHALAEARESGARTAALVAAPSMQATLYADLILASYSYPDPGLRQIMLESIIFAIVRMLNHARPLRFKPAADRVRTLTDRFSGRQIE